MAQPNIIFKDLILSPSSDYHNFGLRSELEYYLLVKDIKDVSDLDNRFIDVDVSVSDIRDLFTLIALEGASEVIVSNFIQQSSKWKTNDFLKFVENKPIIYPNVGIENYIFLAGFIEHYCGNNGIGYPSWIFDSEFYSQVPLFPFKKMSKNLSNKLVLNSKDLYSKRNLYTT